MAWAWHGMAWVQQRLAGATIRQTTHLLSSPHSENSHSLTQAQSHRRAPLHSTQGQGARRTSGT